MRSRLLVAARAILLVAPLQALPAAAQVATDPTLAFDRLEAMVPMRDGVRLSTEVYVPKAAPGQASEQLPILLMRTPYGFNPDAQGWSKWLALPWLRDLLRDGYVLALQSTRGRFRSEGSYTIEPAPRDRSDPRSVDDGTDSYDTVDWLVKHVPSNGRVGMLGVSIPGRLVALAMREHHPAVKAYSPQATPVDNFVGDDAFHGGAFRLSMIEFFPAMEGSKEFTDVSFERADLYEAYLSMGSTAGAARAVGAAGKRSWEELRAHPTYDDYWKRRSLTRLLDEVPAPTLHVGGAFDQEDKRGPVALYRHLEAKDAAGRNFLVVGPWAHRSWRLSEGDGLGRVAFGSPTARYFREEVQAAFFACHLKDRCEPKLPEALIFQTGSNAWQRLPAWPPRNAPKRSLYLLPGRRLGFSPPSGGAADGAENWVSDPSSPVPSLPRPWLAGSADKAAHDAAWANSLVTDQRFVDGRPDVLTFASEPLQEEVVVAGDVSAQLFVSTSGRDADFVAKLIDAWPEQVPGDPTMAGFQLPVAGEILRGRFRAGFEKPEPFTPGKVEEVTIDLLPASHVFKKGHRILVQVHSSWFPLYDRNPQSWVPSIFEAQPADYVAQTHKLFRSPRYPSRITFDTVGR